MTTKIREEDLTEKERFNLYRERKKLIDQYIPEIEQRIQVCNQLTQEIKYQKIKNDSLSKEIKLREDRYKVLSAQYNAISGKVVTGSDDQVTSIKTLIINQQLDELLSKKIPEVGISNLRDKNELKENPFKGLIHENIKVIHTTYDKGYPPKKIEKEKFFKISKNTRFKVLKEAACTYFGIDNFSDYLLTDEIEAIIYDEETEVDEFMKYYSTRINILRLMDVNTLKERTQLLNAQMGRMKEKNSFKGKSKVDKKKGSQNDKFKIKDFMKKFPGITKYFWEGNGNAYEDKANEMKSQSRRLDLSFWMLLLIAVFIGLTASSMIHNNRSFPEEYLINLDFTKRFSPKVEDLEYNYNDCFNYLSSNLLSLFIFNKEDDTKGNFASFYNSFDLKTLYPWKNYSSYDDYFESINSTYLDSDFIPSSPVHIIFEFVTQKKCSVGKGKCYYETYQKKNHYDEVDYSSDEDELKKYNLDNDPLKPEHKSSVSLKLKSILGNIDGSGYQFDLPLNLTSTQYLYFISKFLTGEGCLKIKNEKKCILQAPSLRGVTIMFNVYFKDTGKLGNIVQHFYFLPTGVVIPNPLEVSIFENNIYNGLYAAHDITRLVIFVLVIGLYIGEIHYQYNSRNRKIGGAKKKINRWQELKAVLNPFNAVLFVLSLALFIASSSIRIGHCRKNLTEFLNVSTYVDGSDIGEMTRECSYLEFFLLLVVVIRLMTFGKLFSGIHLLVDLIESSFLIILQFFAMIFIMILGFASAGQLIYGKYIEEYQGYGYSIISTMLYIIGYSDTKELVKYNPGWAITFAIIFFFINLLFIFSFFKTIFIESLRRSFVLHGYPSDNKKVEWSIHDYYLWLIHWEIEKKETLVK